MFDSPRRSKENIEVRVSGFNIVMKLMTNDSKGLSVTISVNGLNDIE